MAYTCVKDFQALFPPPVTGSHFSSSGGCKGFQICSTALSGSDLMAQQQACPIATTTTTGEPEHEQECCSQHRQLQLSTQLWVLFF